MMIDQALEQKPADFDALLKLLAEMGCEVSRRGQAIRLKAPGWKNVARMDEKLGQGYNEAEIRAVLAGEKEHTPRKKRLFNQNRPRSIFWWIFRQNCRRGKALAMRAGRRYLEPIPK